MKAFYKIGAGVMFALLFLGLNAQNEIDGMRYAGTTITGTARVQGMGGAFSAVGADYSAAYLNPAGLALFRRSELGFTPSLRFVNTQTDYAGGGGDAFQSSLGVQSVGYVYGRKLYQGRGSDRSEVKSGIRSFALSLGFNQIANYNRDITVQAYNDQNSYSQYLAEAANGRDYYDIVNEDNFEGIAAWSGLIDTLDRTTYIPAVNGGNIEQTYFRTERGRNNEWSIGLAGNFDNFLYFGGAVGIQSLRYDHTLNYFEEDVNNLHQTWSQDSTPFNSLEMVDQFSTRGTGFNARFGVIVRPADFVRVGLSVQSPTILNLTDTYDGSLYWKVDGDDTNYGAEFLNQGRFSYNLTTAWKATAGVMLMYKKLGFWSTDFEVTDYSSTRFSSSNSSDGFYSFIQENQNMSDLFAFSYNLRTGVEMRANIFRFRGGYANYGSVLNDEGLKTVEFETGEPQKIKGNRQLYTGGVGIKQNNYYLDVAFVQDVSRDRQVVYSVSEPETNGNSPEQVVKRTSSTVLMTLGFTF